MATSVGGSHLTGNYLLWSGPTTQVPERNVMSLRDECKASPVSCSSNPATATSSARSTTSYVPAWGLSATLVGRLGSGLGATVVGVHLVAYVSPMLPTVDLSLLMRLDLGILATAPSSAASAAGLLGSSLAAADVLGARLPLLIMLVVATGLIFVAATPSSSVAPILGLRYLATRGGLRHLGFHVWCKLRPLWCFLAIEGARSCATGHPFLSSISALAVNLGKCLGVLRPWAGPALLTSGLSLLLKPKSRVTEVSNLSSTTERESKRVTSAIQPGLAEAEPLMQCAGEELLDKAQELDSIGRSLRSCGPCSTSGSRGHSKIRTARSGLRSRTCAREVYSRDVADINEDVEDLGGEADAAVTVEDLEELICRLEIQEADVAKGQWELIVDKKSSIVDYAAWRRDPIDGGPTEYKSSVKFYGCNAQQLGAFLLDMEHLMTYENIVRTYSCLEGDAGTATEVVRLVKKYPLCSPREFVLGWRLWKSRGGGPTGTHFCVTKAVEHEAAPRLQRGPRRIDLYKSGWRISEEFEEGVGWAAQADMLVQEECSMQRGVAKLAFRRSVWGYFQNTAKQLRLYLDHRGWDVCSPCPPEGVSVPLAVEHAKPVPMSLRRKFQAAFGLSQAVSMQPLSSAGDGVVSCSHDLSDVPQQNPSHQEQPGRTEPRGVRAFGAGSVRLVARTASWHAPGLSTSIRPNASAPSTPRTASSSNWVVRLQRKALPMLAAAAGIGTMTLARGPVGFVAKFLFASSVRIFSLKTTRKGLRRTASRLATDQEQQRGRAGVASGSSGRRIRDRSLA